MRQITIFDLYGVVNCDKAEIKRFPTNNSEVICTVDKNTELLIEKVLDYDNGFLGVCTPWGVEGYCMSKNIRIK